MRARASHAGGLLLVVVSLGGLHACSREVDPFEANDRDENIGNSPNQLTFSAFNDRTPVWTLGGDSLIYVTEGGGHLPPDDGVLVGLPVAGGVTLPFFPDAQVDGDEREHWLTTPALAPAGDRLAFVEITSTWTAHPCVLGLTTLACTPAAGEETVRRPELREIAVHIRSLDADDPFENDLLLTLAVPGVSEQTVSGPIGPLLQTDVRNTPFHQLFDSERAYGYRVSWSPGGDRLAFSDGVNVRIWDTSSDSAETVPGTSDGVWPAWSPDGARIAFTRLESVDSLAVSCDYIGGFGPLCTQIRTDFVPGRHILTLVRPDGSELLEIGDGDEPAWSPDGSALYFRRGDQIWRSAADGSGAAIVPGTDGGREPAVSPDGQRLAFSRLNPQGIYDVWIIALEP